MSTEEDISLHYPLPIAKLYEAMRLETEPRLRVTKLVELFQGTVRYLALIGLADYIQRGSPDPEVEGCRAGLDKPSLGHWVNLLTATARALRLHPGPLYGVYPDQVYREDAVFESAQHMARILGKPTQFKKIKLAAFLDMVVQFRNRKTGHGTLTTLEARQVADPLEAGLTQWLQTLPVLRDRHLVYVARVEWREPRFVFGGTKLNCGTSLKRFESSGDKPVTHNRAYLHDPSSEDFLPLYPFFVYDDDARLLYIYEELSTQRQLSLRCPYEVPGAEPTHHLAIDVSFVLGSSPPAPVTAIEAEQEPPEVVLPPTEDIDEHLIEEHPANTNLYLSHFLRMYSQSRISNKGTRGYDPLTYTAIKLDEALAPAIVRGDYALVIISGNAGDGKTAFIQRLERKLQAQGAAFTSQTPNGSCFTRQAREYRTVYDGSQDEGAAGSDEVLDDFFGPFDDHTPPQAREKIVRVIAINEGRLLHFLSNRQDRYGGLYKEARRQLAGEQASSAKYLVVNLNRRSVVDGGILDYRHAQRHCILDRLLDGLLRETYWRPCEGCIISERCPVKFNVDTLRDSVLGPVVRQRLKFLFQITHFRHRVHVTIRELRSALAYLLFGLRECGEIRAHIEESHEILPFFYYNAAFAHEEKDRLLSRLAELDVAGVANPQLDSYLNLTPPVQLTGLLRTERRSDADASLLAELFDRRPQSVIQASEADWSAVAQYHSAIRRKYFFENGAFRELEQQTGTWEAGQLPEIQMVPTRHVRSFAGFLAGDISPDYVLSQLIHGLNRGEGMHDPPYDQQYLYLRTSERWAQVKAFALFPASDFAVNPAGIGREPEFIEHIPEAIVLSYLPRDQRVDISLDLYEAILRMCDGYQPSTAEVKGFFQNLQIFKKQILGWGSDEVIVVPSEGATLVLSREAEQTVAIDLV